MATVHAQARALLQQYVDVLADGYDHHQSQLYLCGGDIAEPNSEDIFTKKTWIHANVGNASSSKELQEQLRAFIELVSQLSVNSVELAWREHYYSFWKSTLMDPLTCSHCTYHVNVAPDPTEFDDPEQLMKSDGPRFLLDFSKTQVDDDSSVELSLLRDLLSKKESFQDHEDMLSELTARSRRPRIELAVALSKKKLTALAQLFSLAGILKAVAEQEIKSQPTARGVERVEYEVTTLLLAASSHDEPTGLNVVTDLLVSEASTIQHLRVFNTLMQVAEPAGIQAFQRLIQTTVCSAMGASLPPKLQSLQLENVPFSSALLVSICSALRYQNSLRALDLNWVLSEANAVPLAGDRADVNTKLMWAWLAFGIFHPDSNAQLDRLALSALPLSNEDTTFFKCVLLSPHPCEQLWQLEHGGLPSNIGARVELPASQRVFVHLTSKELRVLPMLEAPVLEPSGLLEQKLEVAMEFMDWVCVVVPGCGFGWTPSAAIMSRRIVQSKCCEAGPVGFWRRKGIFEPRSAANVKTFSRYALACMYQAEGWQADEHDDIEDIKRLLCMIGHCLVKLEFVSHGIHIRDEDLREILDACPNLTHLNLAGNQIHGVTSLTATYAAQQCRITSLNVYTVYHPDHMLSQVAELLEMPTPLRFIGVSGRGRTAELLTRFARALQINQTLCSVLVNDVRDEYDALVAQMQSAFESTPMRVRLSLEARLAFVGVIYAYAKQDRKSTEESTKRNSSSALGTLDSDLLSQIFAFAAIPTGRSLYSLYWT